MRFLNHSNNHLILIIAVFTMVIFVCTACGGGEDADSGKEADDNKPAKEDEKIEAKNTQPPKAETKKTEIRVENAADMGDGDGKDGYQYNPINKVDPFVSFTESGFDQPDVAGSEAAGVLTQFEVRYFRLVGIVADEEQPRAIFEDPRGHAYVVGIGTKIGRNNGVIEQINTDSVLIIEKRIKFTVEGGEPVPVPLTINLHPQREE